MKMKFSDLEKYSKYSKKSKIICFFLYRSVWSIFVYRLLNYFNYSIKNMFVRKVVIFVFSPLAKFIEIVNSSSISYKATIDSGLYIGHPNGIFIHPGVKIGANCNIAQGVTIGISGRGEKRAAPVIGDNVFIGANAVVVGNIKIGDNCVIAPNSLVINSFDSDLTICGVPAKKFSDNNSFGYI